ncbi:periostin [Trichonephila clavipes]|nr:periostin [Trichonephila clavipes]
MGAEFLFMDDNARPHHANIVDECLQSEDITRMNWPAYSPDLNPIEHVWDMLGRRIAARQPPPTCLPELRRALLDEWCSIPQDQIDNLILSLPKRLKPLKNLAETAQEIGASQFVKQADQSGILPLLTSRGAYTVFVARDKAFESLTKEQEKALNASKKSRSRPSVLLYTIVEGRITAEELPKSLHTLYREGSATVTKYPNGLIAINCIPVVATNIEATNGIIHITESLLLSTGRNTISDLLAKTPALSTTATALVRAQLSNELRDKKSLTLFAPTDEAWESLPATFMEALMEDPSTLKVLLRYHIVDTAWCSSVTAGITELKTFEGSTLQLSCNTSGQYVDGARIIEKDFTARNGFVHHIDTVMIPNRVRSLAEYLDIRGMTYFLKLAEYSGIFPLLQRQAAYTLFVPTDDAFEAQLRVQLLETVSGYWIHREKAWASSSKSHDYERRSPFAEIIEI